MPHHVVRSHTGFGSLFTGKSPVGVLAAAGLLAGCAAVSPPAGAPSGNAAAAGPAVATAAGTVPPAGAAASAAAPAASGAATVAALRAAVAVAQAASAPPGATPTPPGGLRPFAEVVKDAKRTDGVLPVWQKEDRVWLELKPSDLGKPWFLSPKYKTGIGEGRFYGGLMLTGEEAIVEFRRVHNQVQLLVRNTDFTAAAGTPTGRAVDAAFSPSLLASTAVVSQPNPESKAVLVEANALFVNDMLGTGMLLQRSYRQGYALDTRNSAITAVRETPDLLVFEVLNHYAAANINVAQPGSPPGAPLPSVPRFVPDARSLFMTLHYSLARLPEQPMTPRRADGRVGYFTRNVSDFSDDLERTPVRHYVNRWRLEKKEPAAALSEPVKPITFWLDRTIPEKYRPAITAGVLEWNKAFEKIGFKDAVRVEVQPDDADWDTLDFGRASIRWMTNAGPSFGAIGPSHVDPRTGEILDADIGVESLSSRNQRAVRSQILVSPFGDGAAASAATADGLLAAQRALHAGRTAAGCEYAEQAAEQFGYAFDVLEARGEIEPNSPQAEAFVNAYLKDVTMHEVGHTLGLRHNFRSSRVYTDAQLSDPKFTAEHGITGSVMEYAPINLAAPDVAPDHRGTPYNTTIGPYDYWAIEYAYKPIAPEAEAAELTRIASRSAEPLLAFGTDEDNALGIDPESLVFDLGADTVAFAKKRIAIGRDLLNRQENRQLAVDADYSVLRRSVVYALRDMGRAAAALTRQIGGVRTVRDHAGSGRDPLSPLPAAEQRTALDVLASGFLSADSFEISPALQRKLAPDYLERTDAFFRGEPPPSTDFSLPAQVVELQRAVLGALLNDAVATRLLDSEEKSPRDALRLSEFYKRLNDAIWSELSGDPKASEGRGGAPARRGDIAPLRRELQRDHVNRLANLLLRPGALSRVDARSLVRGQAQTLLARIEAAQRRGGLSAEARAHLQDSADSLSQALTAKLQRVGT